MTLESQIQSRIIQHLEQLGYFTIKLVIVSKKGVPDVIAFSNHKHVIFVEVKSSRGRLSELQKYRHKQLRDMGFSVIVAYSYEQFLEQFNSLQ